MGNLIVSLFESFFHFLSDFISAIFLYFVIGFTCNVITNMIVMMMMTMMMMHNTSQKHQLILLSSFLSLLLLFFLVSFERLRFLSLLFYFSIFTSDRDPDSLLNHPLTIVYTPSLNSIPLITHKQFPSLWYRYMWPTCSASFSLLSLSFTTSCFSFHFYDSFNVISRFGISQQETFWPNSMNTLLLWQTWPSIQMNYYSRLAVWMELLSSGIWKPLLKFLPLPMNLGQCIKLPTMKREVSCFPVEETFSSVSSGNRQ